MIVFSILDCGGVRGKLRGHIKKEERRRARGGAVLGCFRWLTVAWWPWVRILRSREEEEERRASDPQQLTVHSRSRGCPRLPRNEAYRGNDPLY